MHEDSSEKYFLVINSGSSSLKWAVFHHQHFTNKIKGIIEALGTKEARFTYLLEASEQKQEACLMGSSMTDAFESLLHVLQKEKISFDNIIGIGHRVVHGGEIFSGPALIDTGVIKKIEELAPLAPLHNPVNLEAILLAQKKFPRHQHVAVFDTAFHQTLPKENYLYPLDYRLYENYQLRRYGFHGTSHCFVAKQLASLLKKPFEELSCLIAHLGSGASLCAIKDGKSVQTTMGLTPLEGLMMGTRSGSVDPGIFGYLSRVAQWDLATIEQMLNKRSGLLGVSGLSSDLRVLQERSGQGDRQAGLAIEMMAKSIARELMKLTIELDRIDGIAFTGGIGENSSMMREKVMGYLHHFSLKPLLEIPKTLPARLTAENTLPVYAIATDEEQEIARETLTIIEGA